MVRYTANRLIGRCDHFKSDPGRVESIRSRTQKASQLFMLFFFNCSTPCAPGKYGLGYSEEEAPDDGSIVPPKAKKGGFEMYTLIQRIPPRRLLLEQLPALVGSLVIAELFFKFHSFTLECVAFLATWYVIDFTLHFLNNIRFRSRSTSDQEVQH